MRSLQSGCVWAAAAVWHAALAVAGAARLPDVRWNVCCAYTKGTVKDFLESDEVRAGNIWPEECGKLMSLALARAEEPAAHLWHMCYQFMNMLGKNTDGRLSRKSIRTAKKSQLQLRQFLLQLTKSFPDERIGWTQFVAIWSMHSLCKKVGLDASEQRTVINACAQGSCGPSECIDVVQAHAKTILEDAENWETWNDKTLNKRLFLSQAMHHVAPVDWTGADEITENRDEPWTRFVRRLPMHPGAWSTRELEEHGAVALQTAEDVVQGLERELPAFELLRQLGESSRTTPDRKAVAFQNKQQALAPLAFAQKRSCDSDFPSWATISISGGSLSGVEERMGWNSIFESRKEIPLGTFAAPMSQDLVWSRRCGVVYSWVDLPWASCSSIVDECMGQNLTLEGLSEMEWKFNGVIKLGDTCRIVTSKAVLRSVLDGLLLGEDCKTAVGAGSQDGSEYSKLWPAGYHASPLAVELLEKRVLDDLLSNYYVVISRLSASSPGGPQLEALLGNVTRIASSTFYYLSNMAPLHRGSPTAAIVVHNALWMRLASVNEKWKASARARRVGREVLLCLGLWRKGSHPEETFFFRHADDVFTRHLYGTMLESPRVGSPEGLVNCTAAVLRRGGVQR